MRRLFLLLLLGAMVTAALNAKRQEMRVEEASTLFVAGDRVNLRAGAGVTAGIIGQLDRGSEVQLLTRAGDWVEIDSPLGRGWIAGRFLAAAPPAE